MKKITKKKQEYKEKIKTKASKEQLAKFKECFETKSVSQFNSIIEDDISFSTIHNNPSDATLESFF